MIVQFLSELEVKAVDDGTWQLLAPFCVQIDDERICVPQGYRTDFASIPRLPFVFWVFGDTAHRSAVIHDWLYTCGTKPRAWCDEVFEEAMKLDGLSAWRRKMMWLGVRVGGSSHYGAPKTEGVQ